MKITMLGKSGSGKTTYMLALREMLDCGRREEEFYMTPSANSLSDNIYLSSNWEQFTFEYINYVFPSGTQKTTLFPFDLYHRNDLVSSFQWIDYRGGILDDIFSPDTEAEKRKKEEKEELLGHIAMSNGVLLFADAVTLTNYSNLKDRERHSGAKVLNRLIQQFSIHYPNNSPTIVIVLTKADSDLIDNKWKVDNYSALLKLGKEVFHEVIYQFSLHPSWIGGIVAAGSIGEGNVKSSVTRPKDFRDSLIVDTSITGMPEPVNVIHPLFFCLGATIDKMRQDAQINAMQYQDQIRNVYDTLERSSRFKQFWGRITGEEDSQAILDELKIKYLEECRLLSKMQPYVINLYKKALDKVEKL